MTKSSRSTARGQSTREVQAVLGELYGVEVSPALISTFTEAVREELEAWQSRPLAPLYPIIYFDALYVKSREDGAVKNKGGVPGLGDQPGGREGAAGAVDRPEWRADWTRLNVFFDYPSEIRRVIYTTNAIESLNYSLRRVLKTRGAFPNDEAVRKVLYLALRNVAKKWTRPIQNWR